MISSLLKLFGRASRLGEPVQEPTTQAPEPTARREAKPTARRGLPIYRGQPRRNNATARQELIALREDLQGDDAWGALASELVEAGLTEEEAEQAGVSKRVTESMAVARELSARHQSLKGGGGGGAGGGGLSFSSRTTSLRRAAGEPQKLKWLGLGTRLDALRLCRK